MTVVPSVKTNCILYGRETDYRGHTFPIPPLPERSCSKGSMSEERKVILQVLRRHGVTGGAEFDGYFYAYD